MSKILLGCAGKRPVHIDLDVLVRTRLLVQANSGGGKSWLLRRIAEQAFGKIQVLLLDRDGEYSTLREKYGYVLVGKGGETPADPRSAALVARRLLELNASAVCDLYEMKLHERHRWVRLFLEALVDAPKELWHPVLVIVDEAHEFAPEKGAGESEAADAMISLATRGRKRGFAPIFATQRLGKLRKDAAAELTNILVGQTFMDIDRKRAAEALGIPRQEERKFGDEMKVVEPGYFWALGRAISRERILVKIGSVSTTHAESGSARHAVGPPPAPSKIKALLPKLADLPREAEETAKTESELRLEIRGLKAKLVAKEREQPVAATPRPETKRIEIPVVSDGQIRRLEQALKRADEISARALQAIGKLTLEDSAKTIRAAIAEARSLGAGRPARTGPSRAPTPAPRPPMKAAARPIPVAPENGNGQDLIAGERRMIEILAQFHPGTRTRSQLGALAGYTPSGGTFGNYFGRLKRLGYIRENADGSVSLSVEGLDLFGGHPPTGPRTSRELIDMWRSKLLSGERKMLDVLVETYPESMTREDLGARTGFTATGGTFGNYLGTLRRNALVIVEGENVKAADTLFELQEV
jgi:hypothetical protein